MTVRYSKLWLRILLLTPLLLPVAASAGSAHDRYFEDTFERYQLPGLAVGIVEDGKVAYVRTAGERVAGRGEPIGRATLFKIASNSKAMTTALLARLVDAGRLKWDDPVIRYLPALRMHDPWVTRELQVRDLLIHNSGLGLGAGDLMLWPEPNGFTRADVIAALAHLEPVHSFRSRYAYDNILYIVAGEVAAAAGGAAFEELMRREVFEPLGMQHCRAGAFDRRSVPDVAQPHLRQAGRNVLIRADGDLVPASTSAAAGGMRCSLDDMLAWIRAWLAPRPAVRGWLSPEQRAAVWTPQMPLPLSPLTREWEKATQLSYGYGWRISDANGRLKVAHTGTLAGMYSVLTLLPESRTGWIILINGNGGEARVVLNQVLLKHYTDPSRKRTVEHYARQLERGAAAAPAAARGAAAAARRPASPARLRRELGVYLDPWFGEVSLCAAGETVEFRARKSPLLRGRVMQSGGGLLVDWFDPSVDAEAWLHFAAAQTADAHAPALTLSHVDPDADFSYDWADLAFERRGDCD
jgi:CubicO group peptidase (beta-lactamase class C family)